MGSLHASNFSLQVGSVEEFQGQERSAIFVSTVRCLDSSSSAMLAPGLGFVGCPKRTNVALTRAQSLLVVVGDPGALATADHAWKTFIEFVVNRGCYSGCELPHSLRM